MRKALASFIIVAFAGLLTTSLLAIYSKSSVKTDVLNSQIHYPYFVGY